MKNSILVILSQRNVSILICKLDMLSNFADLNHGDKNIDWQRRTK
jgi:hypothetical protein